MTVHNVSLGILAVSTTLLAIQVGAGLYQALAELTMLISLVTIGYAFNGAVNPTDRSFRTAVACGLGMFFLYQAILWQKGEAAPIAGGVAVTVLRFAFPALLIAAAAGISVRRAPGQYVYNLVVVSAIALWMGQVAANVAGGLVRGLTANGLSAFLQGASTGSAFAYATLDYRGNESGGQS